MSTFLSLSLTIVPISCTVSCKLPSPTTSIILPGSDSDSACATAAPRAAGTEYPILPKYICVMYCTPGAKCASERPNWAVPDSPITISPGLVIAPIRVHIQDWVMCVAASAGGSGSFTVLLFLLFRETGLVARVSERRVRTAGVRNCH